MPEMFEMHAIGIDVSVQRYTENVPDDGRYYLVREGQVVKAYRARSQAVKAFRNLLKDLGYQPPAMKEESELKEILRAERDTQKFYESEMYWGVSHKF